MNQLLMMQQIPSSATSCYISPLHNQFSHQPKPQITLKNLSKTAQRKYISLWGELGQIHTRTERKQISNITNIKTASVRFSFWRRSNSFKLFLRKQSRREMLPSLLPAQLPLAEAFLLARTFWVQPKAFPSPPHICSVQGCRAATHPDERWKSRALKSRWKPLLGCQAASSGSDRSTAWPQQATHDPSVTPTGRTTAAPSAKR